jgi:uncharacterized protein DUF4244
MRDSAPLREEHDMQAPRFSFRRRCAGAHDFGISTIEYAVCMITATAFAALLYKIVTGSEVQAQLLAIIQRALNIND